MIIWNRAPRSTEWIGTVGTTSYSEKFAYTVRPVKPLTARRGKGWQYEYALFTRIVEPALLNRCVRLFCTDTSNFKSIAEAKAFAEQHYSLNR
jgi:hypothetical protein